MKRTTLKAQEKLNTQAQEIVAHIASLMDKYTNDSPISKFFLTDHGAKAIYTMAGAFAAVVYTPALKDFLKVKTTHACQIFYLTITYGVQVYLKEYSYLSNSSPYTFETNENMIEKKRKEVLEMAEKVELEATDLSDKVIDIFTQHFKGRYNKKEFQLEGSLFNEEKFFDYLELSLYWGYNFAKQIIVTR